MIHRRAKSTETICITGYKTEIFILVPFKTQNGQGVLHYSPEFSLSLLKSPTWFKIKTMFKIIEEKHIKCIKVVIYGNLSDP